jgi:hypothetical protein
MMGTGMDSALSCRRDIVGQLIKQPQQAAAVAIANDGYIETQSVGGNIPSRNSRSWSFKITILLFGNNRRIFASRGWGQFKGKSGLSGRLF